MYILTFKYNKYKYSKCGYKQRNYDKYIWYSMYKKIKAIEGTIKNISILHSITLCCFYVGVRTSSGNRSIQKHGLRIQACVYFKLPVLSSRPTEKINIFLEISIARRNVSARLERWFYGRHSLTLELGSTCSI